MFIFSRASGTMLSRPVAMGLLADAIADGLGSLAGSLWGVVFDSNLWDTLSHN